MSILLDTNILTRSAQPHHPMHKIAGDAVSHLLEKGETFCKVPQNLYEFWAVCTRPFSENGLGFSGAQAETELTRLKGQFEFLEDQPAIYPVWEKLVSTYMVAGKSAHDTRLVAAMIVHGVKRILTFNTADFRRFTEIQVIAPADVLVNNP